MKEYPSILGPNKAPHEAGIAFEKLDGSNLRFEWTKKNGWHKFGTRSRLFDETDEMFGEAIKFFKDNFATDLEAIFKKEYRDSKEITVFCEFFGENSFSGQHKKEPHKLVLFDVEIFKYGFVSPRDFVNIFCKTLGDRAAKVVYEGNLNEQFIKDVREGKYPVWEGVVIKGGNKHKLWRAKIKTNAFLAKLKEVYADGWEKYWE